MRIKTRKRFWTTNFFFIIVIIVVVNLDGVFGCGPKKPPLTTTSSTPGYTTKWPKSFTAPIINMLDYTLVDSNTSTTCNQTAEPNKTFIYCFNNGKCNTNYIYLNETHYEKSAFCICAKCYGGAMCRENVCLFDFIEAKVGIILGLILAIAFGATIFFLVRHFKRASLPRETGNKVEKLNKDRENRTTAENNSLLTSNVDAKSS